VDDGTCLKVAEKPKRDTKGKCAEDGIQFRPSHPRLKSAKGLEALKTRVHASGRLDSAVSWSALKGRLGRLERLKVFDQEGVNPMIYKKLLTPGSVTIIDLSDSGMSELNNIVIADLLRGIQDAQEEALPPARRPRP